VRNKQDVLQHLPCLTAHLIAESLGYFTPESAANAIACYTRGEGFYCEWYYDRAERRLASGNTECDGLRDTVKEVGELALQSAIRRRSHHRGPMAEFQRALALVRHVRRGGQGPMFASWF
jgi:hypothetical protein